MEQGSIPISSPREKCAGQALWKPDPVLIPEIICRGDTEARAWIPAYACPRMLPDRVIRAQASTGNPRDDRLSDRVLSPRYPSDPLLTLNEENRRRLQGIMKLNKILVIS